MRVLVLFSFIFLVSCSTSSYLRITSDPKGAKVHLRPVGKSETVEFGETPVKLNSNTIYKKLKNYGPVEITVSYEGYVTKKFIATEYAYSDLDFNINMETESSLTEGKKVDAIVEGLFECQRLMKANKLKEAQEKITNLITIYPNISSLYEFEGSIYFYLNEKDKAYDSFIMALKFNPQSNEAKRMIQVIKEGQTQD